MISLKRYIEFKPEESLKAMCESYRDSLSVMGISATQICPHIGEEVQHSLLSLRDRLSAGADPATVVATGKEIDEQIKKWGESASEYLQQTAHDVKEIMLIVARRARRSANGTSDTPASSESLRDSWRPSATWKIFAKIRRSLGKSAHLLKSSVERMVQDGEKSVSRLRAELSVYQNRLDARLSGWPRKIP